MTSPLNLTPMNSSQVYRELITEKCRLYKESETSVDGLISNNQFSDKYIIYLPNSEWLFVIGQKSQEILNLNNETRDIKHFYLSNKKRFEKTSYGYKSITNTTIIFLKEIHIPKSILYQLDTLAKKTNDIARVFNDISVEEIKLNAEKNRALTQLNLYISESKL